MEFFFKFIDWVRVQSSGFKLFFSFCISIMVASIFGYILYINNWRDVDQRLDLSSWQNEIIEPIDKLKASVGDSL
jgi:hypothetical protein